MGVLGSVAGCLGGDDSTSTSDRPGTETGSANVRGAVTSTSRETETTQEVRRATASLEEAFTEIHSVNLVNYADRVWTPRYQDLGNMDRELVASRIADARSALERAGSHESVGQEQVTEIALLDRIADVAESGSSFYHTFGLTFENIYQYEYYIDEHAAYPQAIERMGLARKKLTKWNPIAESVADGVRNIKRLYGDHPALGHDVSNFDVGRWNYTAFGMEEYARLLEPRLVGFEAYAKGVAADREGLARLDAEEYQVAQDAFKTARTKNRQAGEQFRKADARDDSFFERRANAYENRIPYFDDGYLLHLRAANEFARGNTESAGDLRFEGTTQLHHGFRRHPISSVNSKEDQAL